MSVEKVFNPKSKIEVLYTLNEYKGDAKLIAGGTDIVISLRNKKIQPKVLIDISHLEELKEIKENAGVFEIGGAVTFTQIVDSDLFKGNLYGLNKSAREVGSPQIRNKGTLGGNIANGSSAADIVPPLIALDASIVLESKKGQREIKLVDYYEDPVRVGDDELISKIYFYKPKENQVLSFSKLGLRKALAISRLTISALLELDDEDEIKTLRLASGALARFPMREKEVEDFFLGKKLCEENIEKAILVFQESLDRRLDGRSTLPYKRIAVERMLREALEEGKNFSHRVVKA